MSGHVDRYTSHVIFLQFAHLFACISNCMAQDEPNLNVSAARVSFHLHAVHDVCLSVRCLSLRVCHSPVALRRLPLLFHIQPDLGPALHLQCRQRRGLKPLRFRTNKEYCPMAIYHPLTGYEPNVPDDFHCSETSAMIFQEESGDIETEPSYSCDAELDDETIGKALPSPLFIQEREEPASRRQAYHSHEESLLPAQSFFAHSCTGRPVCELS